VVFVTHDIQEAFTLADRIAFMKAGQILQIDTPQKIAAEPANDFVKGMLQNLNPVHD
jgi:osmoprotectant transport system ATP-binding protein